MAAPPAIVPNHDVSEPLHARVDQRVEERRDERIQRVENVERVERVEQPLEEPIDEPDERVEDAYAADISATADTPVVNAPPPAPVGPPIPLRYVVLLLVAIATTIIVSSAVAVVVGRTLNSPAAAPAATP